MPETLRQGLRDGAFRAPQKIETPGKICAGRFFLVVTVGSAESSVMGRFPARESYFLAAFFLRTTLRLAFLAGFFLATFLATFLAGFFAAFFLATSRPP